jgi:hypothetical protein
VKLVHALEVEAQRTALAVDLEAVGVVVAVASRVASKLASAPPLNRARNSTASSTVLRPCAPAVAAPRPGDLTAAARRAARAPR